jgi:hypothetical protein
MAVIAAVPSYVSLHCLLFMIFRSGTSFLIRLFIVTWLLCEIKAFAGQKETSILPQNSLAMRYFGNDAPWFEKNVPFLISPIRKSLGFIIIGGSFTSPS